MQHHLKYIKHLFTNNPIPSLKYKLDKLYLELSDCDGMCEHCKPVLKSKCFRVKGISEYYRANRKDYLQYQSISRNW